MDQDTLNWLFDFRRGLSQALVLVTDDFFDKLSTYNAALTAPQEEDTNG